MGKEETALISENMFGDKLYQERAREAFPLLVRQAQAGSPIYYEELAEELGMTNPRNLNYPLGSVGKSLIELSKRWKDPIPPIQCLVINKADKTPGEGFGWFMPKPGEWKTLSRLQRQRLTEGVLQQIYAYPRWDVVLREFNLDPFRINLAPLVSRAERAAGGEGEEHRRLKEWVRTHPRCFRTGPNSGVAERPLPSGDCVDVFFETRSEWVGVEVKPSSSPLDDLTRGVFQCVKYQAVLSALAVSLQREVVCRAVLAIGGSLPAEIQVLANMLGVEVVDGLAELART